MAVVLRLTFSNVIRFRVKMKKKQQTFKKYKKNGNYRNTSAGVSTWNRLWIWSKTKAVLAKYIRKVFGIYWNLFSVIQHWFCVILCMYRRHCLKKKWERIEWALLAGGGVGGVCTTFLLLICLMVFPLHIYLSDRNTFNAPAYFGLKLSCGFTNVLYF